MTEHNELCRDLGSPDIDQAVLAAFRLADLGDRSAASALIRVLRDTPHHRLRDASAAALGELGVNEALPSVLALIRDPKTIGHRGSLAYALTHFDCRSHIEDLAFLITDESYEVRQKALMAMDSIDYPESQSQLKASIKYIDKFIKSNNIEKCHIEDIGQFTKKLASWIQGDNGPIAERDGQSEWQSDQGDTSWKP